MSAAVDVEGVAQAASTHRRAFDMPTWATHTPRRLPFGFLRLCVFGRFPQYKVKRIFFVCLNIYPLTGTRLHIGQATLGELAILSKIFDRIIDIARCALIG